MTPKDKEVLVKDLCARLPYGVMVLVDIDKKFDGGCVSKLTTITEIKGEKMFLTKNSLTPVTVEEIRPYLRPMYSMTEEEKNDYLNTFKKSIIGTDKEDGRVWTVDSIDYLNANYFDYRGLIEKDLALEAPDNMYEINK